MSLSIVALFVAALQFVYERKCVLSFSLIYSKLFPRSTPNPNECTHARSKSMRTLIHESQRFRNNADGSYLTTLFLTTRLGVLNMPCRVGITIPGPLYTSGLLANCGTCLLLGQFGNIHYTVYHHTHLVSNIQLFSRFVCLLDISCQYRVPNSIRYYCQCQQAYRYESYYCT